MMAGILRLVDRGGQRRFCVFELIALPQVEYSVVDMDVWFTESRM